MPPYTLERFSLRRPALDVGDLDPATRLWNETVHLVVGVSSVVFTMRAWLQHIQPRQRGQNSAFRFTLSVGPQRVYGRIKGSTSSLPTTPLVWQPVLESSRCTKAQGSVRLLGDSQFWSFPLSKQCSVHHFSPALISVQFVLFTCRLGCIGDVHHLRAPLPPVLG